MRTDKIKLYTSDADYHEFASQAEGRGEKYRMERKLIAKLAMDHSRMFAVIKELGVKFEYEGDEK